jgi:NAD+ diphosphatase
VPSIEKKMTPWEFIATMRASNFYVSTEVKRLSENRRDQDWIAERLQSSRSTLLPVWQNKNLMLTGDALAPTFVPITDAALTYCAGLVFLGLWHGEAYFAANISHHESPPFTELGTYCDLREVGPLLPREDAAILAYARAMTTWQSRHRFCGQCGSPTESREAGHVLACGNNECGFLCFPRTDPAVIMLIHDGADRCILGRQAVWPTGQHSVLAGFVEPGESLEDAVVREVFEEAGVQIADVEYHSSQPWPFPSSIMLGFYGRALDVKLEVDTFELETARWFSRDEIQNCPDDDSFRLPRPDSISRRLIEDWIAES